MVGHIITGNNLKVYQSPIKGDKYTVVPSDNNPHSVGTKRK